MQGETKTGLAPASAETWRAAAHRLASFLVCLIVVALSGVAVTGHAQPAAMVQVDQVITEPSVRTAAVLGRVVATEEGPVAARVAGPVAELAVAVGDRVFVGDRLALLDTTRLALDRALADADVRTAEAELAAARRELELVEQELARLSRLEGSAAFSRARFDDTTKQATVLASRIEAAAARSARAMVMRDYRDADLGDAEIRAPFAGVVVARHVSAGAHVDVGDPVVSLVDDQTIEIEADVPADRLAALSAGLTVGVEIADGGRHEVELRTVVPVENPLTRTRAVRFAAAGVSEDLAIGQSVTVDLPVGPTRDVATVHKDAVTVSLQGRQVFVIADDDTVEPRLVTLGAAIGNRFEVLDGVQPGELVVVRGNERLRPGQAVAYEPPVGAGAAGERS